MNYSTTTSHRRFAQDYVDAFPRKGDANTVAILHGLLALLEVLDRIDAKFEEVE